MTRYLIEGVIYNAETRAEAWEAHEAGEAPEGAEPEAEDETDVEVEFDYDDATMDEVLTFVDGDPDLAVEILQLETAESGKQRKTLIANLEAIASGN